MKKRPQNDNPKVSVVHPSLAGSNRYTVGSDNQKALFFFKKKESAFELANQLARQQDENSFVYEEGNSDWKSVEVDKKAPLSKTGGMGK